MTHSIKELTVDTILKKATELLEELQNRPLSSDEEMQIEDWCRNTGGFFRWMPSEFC